MHRLRIAGISNAMRRRLCLGAASSLAFAAKAGHTENFPSKPITLIIPYGAGGPTDVQVRALALAASKELGQAIVISNVPGAGGTLGPAAMARTAAPNGYTLSVVVGSIFRMPHLQKVNYHPINDFTYVIGLTGYTFGIAVSVDSPWKSLAELIADARKRPGEISAGASGRAGAGHIMVEKLGLAAGVKFNFVPFKGASEILPAMLGRHLDVWADGGFGTGVESGKLRLLATAGERRELRWPDAPTLKESGYDVTINSPYGLAGPSGMGKHEVKILHDAFRKAMSDATFLKALEASSQPLLYLSSADYSKFAAESFERERHFVQELQLKLD